MINTINDLIALGILDNNKECLEQELISYVDKLIDDIKLSDLCYLNRLAVIEGLSYIKKTWTEVEKLMKEGYKNE